MKFRGLISDNNAMREFMNVVNSLSKLSKECVLRILPDNIYFIITEEDHGPRKPFVWCELSNDYYFREFHMAGVSDDANEIYLSFSPSMLAKSVTTVKQGAKSLKIKLTNKQTPCLTLEIDMAVSERHRQCVHDIPVEVITRKYWADYNEPSYDEFHVSVELPGVKSVRSMAERMKSMSSALSVQATQAGRVSLRIQASLASVSAHFHHLPVRSFHEGLSGQEDTEEPVVGVTVDARRLVQFLAALPLAPVLACSIVHGRAAKLSVASHHHTILHCFLSQYDG